MANNYVDLPVEGSSSGVSSLNGMTGALTLLAGTGVTITPGSGTLTIASTGGGGGVSSVGLALPSSVFSISGSPVTASGTLTGAFTSQSGNTFFAAPNGSAGVPSFRAIVVADITGVLPTTKGGTGLSTVGAANTVLASNGTSLFYTAFPSPYVVSTISSNTASVSGTTYLCNTSSSGFTVTLPTPVSGAFIAIKDSTGSFQTNNITIAQNASEMIEGIAASKILHTNWGAWSFFSDGTNWFMGPF